MISVTAAPAVGRSTTAGLSIARAVLLTHADVGAGWRSSSVSSTPPITCPGFRPALRADTEIGAASSPRFQASSSGPFVSQTAYVYATGAEGSAAANALLRPDLLRCVRSGFLAGSGDGVAFTVSRAHSISLPSLAVASSAYRVCGVAAQIGETTNVCLDEIVLAHGQTITALSIASLWQAPSRALELRLARRVADRLRRPGALG